MEEFSIFRNGVVNMTSNNVDVLIEDGVTKITAVNKAFYEVFYPENDVHNGYGVVVCPGGAYSFLSIDLEGTEIAEWLTKLGFTVFILGYEVPEKREKALKNVGDLFSFINKNSNKFNIKKDNIGLAGFSAGAHLCVRYSAIKDEERKELVKNNYHFKIKPLFNLLIYPAYLNKENGLNSDIDVLKANKCATFLFGTEDDPYYKSYEVFSKVLKNNNKHKLISIPEGGHGYGLRKGNKAAEFWTEKAEEWLKSIILENEKVSSK